jgi:hypothetical protein
MVLQQIDYNSAMEYCTECRKVMTKPMLTLLQKQNDLKWNDKDCLVWKKQLQIAEQDCNAAIVT